jgi:argininosuccinate lyase
VAATSTCPELPAPVPDQRLTSTVTLGRCKFVDVTVHRGAMSTTDRLWAGGYAEATHALVAAMNASVDFDRELARDDIVGSLAHATMLRDQGILQTDEWRAIVSGLRAIWADIAAGTFVWQASREDVHMNIEASLKERIGAPAGRLHTARSRNDQVALDERLWLRRQLAELAGAIATLSEVLANSALNHAAWPMPGYTHLQRAQPVTLGHHLLAHVEALLRDGGRVLDALGRNDVCPLGSGALAGTTLPIDRQKTAQLLGFSRVSRNSLDAVGDRDHLVEAMAAAALGCVHLSRLGEELVLFASAEFGYVRLTDAFTTGSSLMPQKKNPDIAELVRGKAGRVIGDLVALLTVLKGLPLAYNKDLQEDKEPLFDALRTWRQGLDVLAPMLAAAEWRKDALAHALDRGFLLATDLADVVVEAGVPFREAHERVARLVAELAARGRTFRQAGAAAVAASLQVDASVVQKALDVRQALRRRDLPGGPHPRRVRSEARAALRRAGQLRTAAARWLMPSAAERLLAGD